MRHHFIATHSGKVRRTPLEYLSADDTRNVGAGIANHTSVGRFHTLAPRQNPRRSRNPDTRTSQNRRLTSRTAHQMSNRGARMSASTSHLFHGENYVRTNCQIQFELLARSTQTIASVSVDVTSVGTAIALVAHVRSFAGAPASHLLAVVTNRPVYVASTC